MKKSLLPYNPGSLPTKKAPKANTKVEFMVEGLPPVKKPGISLRNPKNPRYDSFVKLREAATKAMKGRSWYFGPIGIDVTIYHKKDNDLQYSMSEYIGGIADSLDGSSGVHFTCLPIVFEDDCQICESRTKLIKAERLYYQVKIYFK